MLTIWLSGFLAFVSGELAADCKNLLKGLAFFALELIYANLQFTK